MGAIVDPWAVAAAHALRARGRFEQAAVLELGIRVIEVTLFLSPSTPR